MELGLIFGGVIVSVIVQVLKKWGTGALWNIVMVVALSIIGGAGMFLLKSWDLWNSFLQILTSAGAFYAFILKNTQK